MNKVINREDIEVMSADSKIGLMATIDETGSPHITFLSSLQPLGLDQLTIGQFCEGLSKKFWLDRKEVGFLIFSPDMEIWRGRARYDHSESSGSEYEMYNKKPLFRYNSYFGFGIIHYFALVDISVKEKLTMGKIIGGALKTRLVLPFAASSEKEILNGISREMFGQIDGLKFISYLDRDGYPCLLPIIQAANGGSDRIIFSMNPYREELQKIPAGAKVAVLFVNLKMESVLVKGSYLRADSSFIPYGRVDLERVYNSMPPQPQYIYPQPRGYRKVTEF